MRWKSKLLFSNPKSAINYLILANLTPLSKVGGREGHRSDSPLTTPRVGNSQVGSRKDPPWTLQRPTPAFRSTEQAETAHPATYQTLSPGDRNVFTPHKHTLVRSRCKRADTRCRAPRTAEAAGDAARCPSAGPGRSGSPRPVQNNTRARLQTS